MACALPSTLAPSQRAVSVTLTRESGRSSTTLPLISSTAPSSSSGTHTDSSAIARRLAQRIWTLRIFEPADPSAEDGPREVSAADLGAPLLVISQFTLYAQTSKGRRPTWDLAAPGHIAEPLVDCAVDELRSLGAEVSTGVFGATMAVSLVNVGPMTILLDVDD